MCLHQVYVPCPDQKHHSDRPQPKPSSGDHPLHHRDPHLGRPEWQLCVWVSLCLVATNMQMWRLHGNQSDSFEFGIAVRTAWFANCAHSFKLSFPIPAFDQMHHWRSTSASMLVVDFCYSCLISWRCVNRKKNFWKLLPPVFEKT